MAFIKVQNVVKDSASSIVSVQPQLLRLFIYQASKITPTKGFGNISERSFIWLKTKQEKWFCEKSHELFGVILSPKEDGK